MAKQAPAAEFNMSEEIREILSQNPDLSGQEVSEAIMAKYPTAKINKNSFSVAFYTGRKKLRSGKGKKVGAKVGIKKSLATEKPSIDLAMIQSAVKFIREVGSAEAALEVVKLLQES